MLMHVLCVEYTGCMYYMYTGCMYYMYTGCMDMYMHICVLCKLAVLHVHVCSLSMADILVTTPNRLVHMLSQEPPTIRLNK